MSQTETKVIMKKNSFCTHYGSISSRKSCVVWFKFRRDNGVGALQNLLFNASSQGFNILGNPQEFMTNALIESAMPEELRKVNNTLESVGLGNLVKKENNILLKQQSLPLILLNQL